MKVLITGATGFIGQHLIEEFKNETAYSLRLVTRKRYSTFWSSNTNFEIHEADISDISALEPAFQGIDIVVNLAVEKNDPSNIMPANIQGVKNIIELSEKFNIKKIIHLSSVSVFGVRYSRSRLVIGDDFPCHPKTDYGTTKLQSELLLKEFGKKTGKEIIILRSGPVFGEHQSSNYLLDIFERVKGKGSFPRSKNCMVNFVYVKDVTNGILFFIKNEAGSKVAIVNESVPFTDFIKMVSDAVKVPYKINVIPSFLFYALEVVNYFGIANLSKKFRSISNSLTYNDATIRSILPYKYGLKEGLKRTIKYYNL